MRSALLLRLVTWRVTWLLGLTRRLSPGCNLAIVFVMLILLFLPHVMFLHFASVLLKRMILSSLLSFRGLIILILFIFSGLERLQELELVHELSLALLSFRDLVMSVLEIRGVINLRVQGRFSMHAVCTSVATNDLIDVGRSELTGWTLLLLLGDHLDLLMQLVLELLLSHLCTSAVRI
jgi:hypothetical protein